MKILICDDHQIVREGLKIIVSQLKEVKHIVEAKDGEEAICLLKGDLFDIVLLDISLPGKSGLDILHLIKQKWPKVKVLILSMHPEDQYAMRAIRLGASGYLTKNSAPDELLIAIKNVAKGGKYISQVLGENLISQFDSDNSQPKHDTLSNREFEIMLHIASGKSIDDISKENFISAKTVTTYRARLMAKMGFKKNTQLTKYCMENGLI
jgi:two-component system, NarL family, invasion response regulator UvrY